VTCEEFRDCWDDRNQPTSGALDHRSECAGCAAWVHRQSAFDGMLVAALVVAPPPELVGRLGQIPATVYETVPAEARAPAGWAPTPYGLALEAGLIALIGFAAIAFGGFDPVAGFEVLLARVGNVLQAIPLVIDSPLLSYLQGLAFTAVEALATLVLIGLSVVQLSSESIGYRSTSEPTVQ
jgi:hypothetical protein